MYLGYFDEFGHNGHYVSKFHDAYKTHPVFGLAGFIIPADNVRELSKIFKLIKERGLADEISAKVLSQGGKPERWEKKGASLLTTTNIKRYQETRHIIFRVLKQLESLDAKIVFYGQEKTRGTPSEISETTSDRYNHCMYQLILRVHGALPDNKNFLLFLDKQGNKERLEIFASAAAFMFSSKDAKRLLEPPMELESHLYQTVQCADWICALIGRLAAYKYDPDFHEYDWAIKYFGARLKRITSSNSKIRGADTSKDLKPHHLTQFGTCYDSTKVAAAASALEQLRDHYS